MQIEVELSSKGIKKAIDELEKYKDSLKDFNSSLAGNLGEVLRYKAQEVFDQAEYDGYKYANIYAEDVWNNGEFAICDVHAFGDCVPFIEFGAGVKYQQNYPIEKPSEIVGIGEYGQHHGRNDWWLFKDDGTKTGTPSTVMPGYFITHGNAPAMFMWKGLVHAIDAIPYISDMCAEMYLKGED